MNLIIVHNHFRPGGVRRVIEMAAPHLARELRAAEVLLVSGECPDRTWFRGFKSAVAPARARTEVDQSMAYFGEQVLTPSRMKRALKVFIEGLLVGRSDCVVWAHNQGLGRNLLLTQQLQESCGRHQVPLMLHHHDWWFDNRWQRWPEMRSAGFQDLDEVARAVFGSGPRVRHIAINRADAGILRRHLGGQADWLPNPVADHASSSREGKQKARQWLARLLEERATVWLMPCRLLRRKNIAEALLLTRWLRPDAWLITTGGPSSPEEESYARTIAEAAQRQQWRLRLGVLAGESRHPPIHELLGASEAALLTSLQEGFGLPFLEAAAAQRPLIARELPNVTPDLARFGFHFPQTYAEILVDPGLFSWADEVERQQKLYRAWSAKLPGPCRSLAGEPVLLSGSARSVPFSRLTLTAQLEVLSAPLEESWAACARLNPFLESWRRLAQAGELKVTRWPKTASSRLGGHAYARKWRRILSRKVSKSPQAQAEVKAQSEFIRERLASSNLFPLIWS